ncbi:antibiotic resistance protein VanZ [Bradyrhizobium sp. LTSPM299]|uniref:VanZ family protein n=1 Tax=Bradyrhizobium sp. LTSPM299 TaxID=1619233 RepID=UPI0005CB78AB|nr:VanZ family protein [Bradyrhizobium sp. LTSPM299]KJC62779.1 antibiotic resistance protein VanZ [Bradyrhizobium sp. LTSPM299]
MHRIHVIAATVACLLLIVYATLTSMSNRPVLLGPNEAPWIVVIERFVAYLVFGFLLSWLFPGRTILACTIAVGIAILLELLQGLRPDRDPAVLDVLEKAVGGIVGVFISRLLPFRHSN